jgi:hypothetical protein
MKLFLKAVMISLIVMFSSFVVIVFSIFLFNGLILSSNAPKAIRLLVQAVAPPEDLYSYLVIQDLDISEKGLIKRFEFKNKYAGWHEAGIVLDNFPDDLYFKPLSQRYNLKLKMKVNFYFQNTLILSHVIENEYHPFLGRRGNGFSLTSYDSPNDLPLNKLITCEVIIIAPDKELSIAYGPVRFYISKESDK